MPEQVGPFIIRGQEYKTDAQGEISRQDPPAPPSLVVERKRELRRLRRRLRNKEAEANNRIAECTAERDAIVAELTDLQTLINAAKEDE